MLRVTETFTPSLGILSLDEITTFTIVSIILMDTDLPAVVLILLLNLIIPARIQQLVSGLSTLLAQVWTVDCSIVQ